MTVLEDIDALQRAESLAVALHIAERVRAAMMSAPQDIQQRLMLTIERRRQAFERLAADGPDRTAKREGERKADILRAMERDLSVAAQVLAASDLAATAQQLEEDVAPALEAINRLRSETLLQALVVALPHLRMPNARATEAGKHTLRHELFKLTRSQMAEARRLLAAVEAIEALRPPPEASELLR